MNKTFKVIYNHARKTLMVVNEKTRSLKKKSTKTVIATASILLASSAFAADATEPVTWDSATPPTESSITVTKTGTDSGSALTISGSASGTLSDASVTLTATGVSATEKEVRLSAAAWKNSEVSNSSGSVIFGGSKTAFTVSAEVTDETNPVSVTAFSRHGAGTPVSFEATTTDLSATITSNKGQSVAGLSVVNFSEDEKDTVVNLGGTTVNISAQTSAEGTTLNRTVAAYGIENKAATVTSTAKNLNVTANSRSATTASAADAYAIVNLGGTITASNQTKIEATTVAGTAAGLEVKSLTQKLSDDSIVTNVATVDLANVNITATSTSSKAGAILLYGEKDSSGKDTTTANLKISGDLEASINGSSVQGIYSEGDTSTVIEGNAKITATGVRGARAVNLHGGSLTIKGDSVLTAKADTAGNVFGILTDLNAYQTDKDKKDGSTVNLEGNVTIKAETKDESSSATGASARYYSTVNLGSAGKEVSVSASGYNAKALESAQQDTTINLGAKDAKLTKATLTVSNTGTDALRGYAIWTNLSGAVNVYAETYEQTSSDVGIAAQLGGTVTLDVGTFTSKSKTLALYAAGDKDNSGTIDLKASEKITIDVENESVATAIYLSAYGKATLEGDTKITAKATKQNGIYNPSQADGIYSSHAASGLTIKGAVSITAESPDYAHGMTVMGGTVSLGEANKDVSITAKALRSTVIVAQNENTIINMGTSTERLKSVTLKAQEVVGDYASSTVANIAFSGKVNVYAQSYEQASDSEGIALGVSGSLTMVVDSFTSTTKDKTIHAAQEATVTIDAAKFTAKQTQTATSLIKAEETGTKIAITSDEMVLNLNPDKVTSTTTTRVSAFSVRDGAELTLSKKADTGTTLTANVDVEGKASAMGMCISDGGKVTVKQDTVTINLNQAKKEGTSNYANDSSRNARGFYANASSTAKAGSTLEIAGNVVVNSRANHWALGIGAATDEGGKVANTVTVKGDATLTVLTDGEKSETDTIEPTAHGIYTFGADNTVTVEGNVTIDAQATASDSCAVGILSQVGGIVNVGSADKTLTINAKSNESAALVALDKAKISVGSETVKLSNVTFTNEALDTSSKDTSEGFVIYASDSSAIDIHAKEYTQTAATKGICLETGSTLTMDVDSFKSETRDSAIFAKGDGSSVSIKATGDFSAKTTSASKDYAAIEAQEKGTVNIEAKNITLEANSNKWDVLSTVDSGSISVKASETLTFNGIMSNQRGTIAIEGKSLNLTASYEPLHEDDAFFYATYTEEGESTITANKISFNLSSTYSGKTLARLYGLSAANKGVVQLKPKDASEDSSLTITQDYDNVTKHRGISLTYDSKASIEHKNVTVNLNQTKNEGTDEYASKATSKATGVYISNSSLEINSGNLTTNVRAKNDAYGLYAVTDAEESDEKAKVTIAGDTTINAIAEELSGTEIRSNATGLFLSGASASFGKDLKISATADKSSTDPTVIATAYGIIATGNSEASFGTSEAGSTVSITADARYASAIQISDGSKLSFGKEGQECASVTLKTIQGDSSIYASVISVRGGSTLDVYTKEFSQEGAYDGLYLADDGSGESNAVIKATDTFKSTTGKSAIYAIGSKTKATVDTKTFTAESTGTATNYALLKTSDGAAIEVNAESIELKATGNKNAIEADTWGSINLKASNTLTVNGNINATFTSDDSSSKTASFYLKGEDTLTVTGDVNVSRTDKLEGDVSTVLSLDSANATLNGAINVKGNSSDETSLTIDTKATGTNLTYNGAISVTDGATLTLFKGTYTASSFTVSGSTLQMTDTTVVGTIGLKNKSEIVTTLASAFKNISYDSNKAPERAEAQWTIDGDDTSTLTVSDTFNITTTGLTNLKSVYSSIALNLTNATLVSTSDLVVDTNLAVGEYSTDKTVTVNETKSFGISGKDKSSTIEKVILNAKTTGTQGGAFKTSNQSQVTVKEIEANAGSAIAVTGESKLHIGTLSGSGTGTKIIVGEVGGEGATLSVDKLLMTGGYIFVDPAIGHSTFTVSEYGTDGLNNRVTAANGSLVIFGATESVAKNAISQIDGLDVDALVYVASPLTLGESGSLLINSEATDSATDYADVTKVQITKGALVFDQNGVGTGPIFTDAASVTVAADATIAVVNPRIGTSVVITNNTLEVTGSPTVLTDSPFVAATLNSSDKTIVLTQRTDQAGSAVIASFGVQSMIRRADMVLAETLADRAATDVSERPNLWVNVRGERFEQDGYTSGAGYTADMGYALLGVDVPVSETKGFGAAFQYGHGKVKGDTYSAKNKLKTYSATLYGNIALGNTGVKLTGELAYTKSTNDLTNAYYAGLNQDLDAKMLSVGATAQKSFEVGNATFTPSLGVRVSRLKTDAMKVGANEIAKQKQTLVQVPIALRLTTKPVQTENGWLVSPSFKLAYIPTFGDKDVDLFGVKEKVIDTSPVQGAFGVKFEKDNCVIDATANAGVGNRGTSSIGAKVGFTYRF